MHGPHTRRRPAGQLSGEVYDGSHHLGTVIGSAGGLAAFDPDGNLVGTYNTVREAAHSLPCGSAS